MALCLLQADAIAQIASANVDVPSDSSADSVTLPTIEAIGTSSYRTGDVITAENSSSSSHVERAELERVPGALAEVLARETGVQYRQSGGFGSFASLSIRAATSAQTAIYLDGVLLNSGGNAVVDLSTLEMLNLGSVDIYRGTTPLQLGHAGIGGAVNLNTLSSPRSPQTRVRLDAGSLSLAGLLLSHQATYGRWDAVASVSRQQSENDFTFVNTNGTPLNTMDDRVEKRNNADAVRTAALLRTGYRQSDSASTDFILQVSARQLGVPEWRNRQENVASYDTEASQVQFSQVLDALGPWNSRHSVYWHRDTAHFDDSLSQVGVGAQDIENHTRTLGAKTYWEHLADTATLGLSLEVRREQLDSTDSLATLADLDARRDSTLGTLHYAWINAADTWSITPAIRWQASTRTGTSAATSTDSATDASTSHTGLQIGVAYRPSARITVTTNAGNYYREPSFGELYGSIGLISGNPDLQPEEGVNLDVGIRYENESTRFSATLFGSERDELIATSFNARGIGRPVNTGAARILGLELDAEFAVSPRLDLRSNLTWQDPRSRERAAGFQDKFLPGEAQLAWFARIQYRLLHSVLWYEFDALNKRFFDRANLLPANDTRQHSIGLDWHKGRWQATLSLHNLGDDNIEDFNGFPKPGRTWSLSVTRSFDRPS